MMIFARMTRLFELAILFSVYLLSNQQQNHIFQSSLYLTPFGTQFQPSNSIELLGTFSNIRSILRCTMLCNQNRQCRTFDYDQSSLVCRLFEGELVSGTIVYNSTPMTSRIGAINYNTTIIPTLYSAYNQTCDQCTDGGNRYLQCINNICQCPINTYWNGQMCANQVFNGSNCSSASTCRQDLNLTCYSLTSTCTFIGAIPSMIFSNNDRFFYRHQYCYRACDKSEYIR